MKSEERYAQQHPGDPVFPMTHYKILGVEEDCDVSVVKKSFRKLALSYHPDKRAGGDGVFRLVQESYEVLSDSTSRQAYDKRLVRLRREEQLEAKLKKDEATRRWMEEKRKDMRQAMSRDTTQHPYYTRPSTTNSSASQQGAVPRGDGCSSGSHTTTRTSQPDSVSRGVKPSPRAPGLSPSCSFFVCPESRYVHTHSKCPVLRISRRVLRSPVSQGRPPCPQCDELTRQGRLHGVRDVGAGSGRGEARRGRMGSSGGKRNQRRNSMH